MHGLSDIISNAIVRSLFSECQQCLAVSQAVSMLFPTQIYLLLVTFCHLNLEHQLTLLFHNL